MPQITCPDRETLSQLLGGTLPDKTVEELESHLFGCEHCLQIVDTLADLDPFFDPLRSKPILPTDEEVPSAAIQRAYALRGQAETVQSEETLALGEEHEILSHDEADSAIDPLNDEPIDFLHPPQAPDEIGRLGGYRILEVMGVGGMGVVFRAEDPQLKRQIALKVMKPSAAASKSAKERFLREAQAVAAIEHHHIVSIYQVGEDSNVPFIAMQFLRGESLQTRLKRERKLGQLEVLRIGREVASGLAAAHEQGLIHRDIKPDNIWIDEATGWAKILDFGLARTAKDDAGLTRSGVIVGTPRYMAPEQAHGEEVDHRCDLFSLGSVLYHLVSGRPPFKGKNVTATLIAVAHEQQQPIARLCPNLHSEFCALVDSLLAKDPVGRPQSAAEVAQALLAIEHRLKTEPATGPPEIQPKPSADNSDANAAGLAETLSTSHAVPPRRRLQPLLLVLGAAALLIAVAVIYINTGEGVVEVTVNEPDVKIQLDGKEIRISSPRDQITVKAGRHEMEITKDGFTSWTQRFQIRRNDKVELSAVLHPRDAVPLATPVDPTPVESSPGSMVSPDVPPVVAGPTIEPVRSDFLPGLVADPKRIPGVRRWQAETYLPRKKITAVAWSPDDRRVAVGTGTGEIRIYDAQSHELIDLLLGDTQEVTDLTWHPRTGLLASASYGKRIHVWSIGTHSMRVLPCTGMSDIAWSPDGNFLATATGNIMVWNRTNDSITTVRSSHNARYVSWSPDSQQVAGLAHDGTVAVYHLNGNLIWENDSHNRHMAGIAWSPDGKWIATGNCRGPIELWHSDGTKGGTLEGTLPEWYDLAWSPNSDQLAAPALTPGFAWRIWKVGEETSVVATGKTASLLRCLAWNHAGVALVTSGNAGGVQFWKSSGQPTSELKGRDQLHFNAAWNADGSCLAAGDGENLDQKMRGVHVWNPSGEQLKPTLVKGLKWSGWHPSQNKLLFRNQDGIEICDLEGDVIDHWNITQSGANGMFHLEPRRQ